jgi:hypothetical protein
VVVKRVTSPVLEPAWTNVREGGRCGRRRWCGTRRFRASYQHDVTHGEGTGRIGIGIMYRGEHQRSHWGGDGGQVQTAAGQKRRRQLRRTPAQPYRETWLPDRHDSSRKACRARDAKHVKRATPRRTTAPPYTDICRASVTRRILRDAQPQPWQSRKPVSSPPWVGHPYRGTTIPGLRFVAQSNVACRIYTRANNPLDRDATDEAGVGQICCFPARYKQPLLPNCSGTIFPERTLAARIPFQ